MSCQNLLTKIITWGHISSQAGAVVVVVVRLGQAYYEVGKVGMFYWRHGTVCIYSNLLILTNFDHLICLFWPTKHLRHVLTLEPEQTWISSNSGLHDCSARTADKYWVTIEATRSTKSQRRGKICISHPPAGTFCVPEEIWYFPILYSSLIFPAVFSQVHSLGRWLVLHSPNNNQPKCTSFTTAPRLNLHFNVLNVM